jgi:hypothetical protein
LLTELVPCNEHLTLFAFCSNRILQLMAVEATLAPAITTGSYPASRVMTPSNGSKTDSDLLGGSSCEIAVERGRRILLALEKPQNEGREHKPSPTSARPPTPLLDHPDLFTQIAHGCQMGSGEDPVPTFYEFFAGGGMARAGLGAGWRCTFANDFDEMKAATYRENWGADHLVCGDVANVKTSDLPGIADLSWASFPCQDLSLAGDYRGLGRADGGHDAIRDILALLEAHAGAGSRGTCATPYCPGERVRRSNLSRR